MSDAAPSRRVILLSSLPPPVGGIATWTRVLLERGLPGGFEIDLVDTALGSVGGGALSPGQLARTGRILRGLGARLRAGPALAVHVNMAPLAPGVVRDLLCGVLARLAGVPVVLHHHGLSSRLAQERRGRWRRAAVRRLARLAAVNVVMNEPDRGFVGGLVAGTDSRVVSLPNFFDEQAHPEPDFAARPTERKRRVLFVAALSRLKGTGLVVRVARSLPEVAFHVVGPAQPETAELLADAPANLQVYGELSHAEVLSRLAEADLFLFPTLHPEGFPYGVLEAMASGVPVVTTPVAALPEMIEDGRGGRVVSAEVQGLADAVAAVLADDVQRAEMGRFNRERALARYAYPVVAAALAEVYVSLDGPAG